MVEEEEVVRAAALVVLWVAERWRQCPLISDDGPGGHRGWRREKERILW
jgi:hypothetical protein